MEQEFEEFEAVADDGTVHTIVCIQEYVDDLSGPIKGMRRLELLDGSPVNYIDDSTFKIVHTGQIVRKLVR